MNDISQFLCFVVTRLECIKSNGKRSFGTGFFYGLHDDGETHVPILITNRHVVKDSISTTFRFSRYNNDGEVDASKLVEVTIPSSSWFNHPDEKIDLCATHFGHIYSHCKQQGVSLVHKTINRKIFVPSIDVLTALPVMEDVYMAGYPIGIWDEFNNRPIIRKGITATHAGLPFNGKKEFLVDIAAFPGSSGSPIFMYKEGINIVNSAGTKLINRDSHFHFIGVLWGGPMHTAKGEIIAEPIPTSTNSKITSRIPTNLGYVISSQVVDDFETVIGKLPRQIAVQIEGI